jgi:hypothetical protein
MLGGMRMNLAMENSATATGATCSDCGAPAGGNFCASCGADLRSSSLGFLGPAVAPVRRSFPVVYLKLLRAPIRQTVAFAEDPTYRGQISFALTGIAIYVLLFVPIVMQTVVPAGSNVQFSESMQTLMKVLSQVGIYVGMAAAFALAYVLFRFFAKVQRPLHLYFKLYCLALGFVAPIYGVWEFLVRGTLGGISMSSFAGVMAPEDWGKPSTIASAVLALTLWAYFIGIHRRFWAMPVWKATVLYVGACLVANQLSYHLMWYVGFYTAQMLTQAGIVTP